MKKLSLLLILLSLFCSPLWCQENKESQATVVFVGRLLKNHPKALRNPSEYVLEDGYLYESSKYRVSNLNLYANDPQDLSKYVGKVVIVKGHFDQNLNKILAKKGKAPKDYAREESMMQIRSDWVGAETGFTVGHSTKERLKHVSFLRYTKVSPFSGFVVKQAKEGYNITFGNTFDKTLQDIEVTSHYESYQGKPVPLYQREAVFSLKPGEEKQLFIGKQVKKGRAYVIEDVLISVREKNLIIDINYSLN